MFSLPILEIHFPSCRVFNAPKLYHYIFLKIMFMLPDRIEISKPFGPDKLPGTLLQCQAKEITLVVHYILTQSRCTGKLPTELTQAKCRTYFKKGSKLQAVNYRPVSLTCITCKLYGAYYL